MHKHPFYNFDEHRKLAFPGNEEETIDFSVEDWIRLANESIKDHKFFGVALSGGSTPKKIYQKLAQEENRKKIDWEKVYLFWSDERSVSPDNPESNYLMAINALKEIGIPQKNIFRMIAEKDIQTNASAYESVIFEHIKNHPFDLIMLGMGEDGHTASLFPNTKALHEDQKLVTANFIPQKNTWRMTLTYKCINEARNIHIYVIGKAKEQMLEKVFTETYNPILYPIQKVGTKQHPALWIIDEQASPALMSHLD